MNEDMNVFVERRGRPKGSLDTKRRISRPKNYVKEVSTRKHVRYDGESEPRSKLEALRFSLALSIDKFSEMLGISHQLLSLYERKKSSPSLEKWIIMKDNAKTNGIDLNEEILNDLIQKKIDKEQRTLDRQKARLEDKILLLLKKKEKFESTNLSSNHNG